MKSMIFTFLVTVLCLGLSTNPLFAHSHLEASSPKSGEVLASAPEAVTLTFEELVIPKGSEIIVTDSKKHQVSDAESTKVSENKKELSVNLHDVKSGTYTVKWKAVCMCADHHVTSGSYTFTVK